MIVSQSTDVLASAVLTLCRKHKLLLATVESCTGGMIAAALTDIAGSSDVVEGGFITYSNFAKMTMVGVDSALLDQFGAVSESVAIAMAQGAIRHSRANISVAVTGVAGPGGGTMKKPVGLVHFAVAMKLCAPLHFKANFGDIGRTAVREATVHTALNLVASYVDKNFS